MPERATLQDVADHAGVSVATVSAVVNNKPIVKESTRKKVLDAIAALEYAPPEMEARLREVSQRSIGLVVKEIENPYFIDIARGVREHAAQKGYSLLVGSSEGSHEEQMNLVAVLRKQGAAGVILSPVLHERSDLSYLFELNRGGYPLVLFEEVRGLQADLVVTDNTKASKLTATYLIDGGHTHVVHFAGPDYTLASRERIDGFQLAFSESHLKFQPDFVISAGAHVADGYERALAYFKEAGDARPTAVSCFNDQVAMGVYKALHELGIDVPGEVSIIGHDGVSILQHLAVPLSSASSSPRDKGRKAAEMLVRRIEAEHPFPPQKVVQEVELVIQQSTRSVNSEERYTAEGVTEETA